MMAMSTESGITESSTDSELVCSIHVCTDVPSKEMNPSPLPSTSG